MKTITLDAAVIEAIAGHYDEALRLIEDRFRVTLAARGTDITVSAPENGNGAEDVVSLRGRVPAASWASCIARACRSAATT